MKNRTFLLLLILPFLPSCSDDDMVDTPVQCDPFQHFGDFYLIESSHDFLPYTASDQKIIMSDSTGQEYEGILDGYNFGLNPITRLTPVPCEEDSTQTFQVRMNTEAKYVTAVFEEWDLKVLFRLSVSALGETPEELAFTDYCNIALLQPQNASSPLSQLSLIVDPRTNPFATMTTPLYNTYTLHGKEFHDVYTGGTINDDQIQILYNREFGLIGLETNDKSMSLKFERME